MLDYLGWSDAADLVRDAVEETISSGQVTYDLHRQIEGGESSRRASSPTPSSTRRRAGVSERSCPEIADFREHRITVVDRFSGLRPPTGGIEKLA